MRNGRDSGSACGGFLLGLLMIIGSIYLLWWNEGSAVEVYTSLQEGMDKVISVPDPSVLDTAVDGKLVHMRGRLKGSVLEDPTFGVVVHNAISLKRHVEVFQWQEKKRSKRENSRDPHGKAVTTVTYDYQRVWSSILHKSSDFHDPERAWPPNPLSMPFRSKQHTADVSLGAYSLSSQLVNKISWSQPLDLSRHKPPASLANSIPAAIGYDEDRGRDRYYEDSRGRARDHAPKNAVTVQGGAIHIGSTGPPKIGDVRVSFAVTYPDDVSVVAEVHRDRLAAYVAENGRGVELLARGLTTAKKMFSDAISTNTALTWMVRGGGMVLMFIGANLLLSPVTALAGMIPLIGSMLAMLAGIGVALVSLLLTLAVSLLVISTAWLYARPILSLTLLLGAVGILFITGYKSRSQHHNPPHVD